MSKNVIMDGVGNGVPAKRGMYFRSTEDANVICILASHGGCSDFIMVDISNGDIYHDGVGGNYSVNDIESDGYVLLNFETIRLEN